MKKIIFIVLGYDVPSSRVRVLNLLSKLEKKGYEITCKIYPKGIVNKLKLFYSLINYDIVYLQKKMPSLFDKFFIRKFSKKLIFDLDDAIYFKHENSKKEKSFSNTKKFNRIVKAADFITVGNEILYEYVSKFNKNIGIIPSTVEINNIAIKDYNIENKKFIVGWVGGNVNHNQLKLLENVFEKLSSVIPLEVRVITGIPVSMKNVDIKFIPWNEKTQEIEIAKCDVGVMPLPNSLHAQGKCAFKAIQYMASGVVPIVSDVGVNSKVVIHNETGFVAKSIDDFYTHIKHLCYNKYLLKQMGQKSRQRAIDEYSIDVAVNKLDEVFKKVANN